MKSEILTLIGKSLLLDIQTKTGLRSSLENLSEFQMSQLLKILKIEHVFLDKVLTETLQDPQKEHAQFMKSFSEGIKQAFKEKEARIHTEESIMLENLDKELDNI